MKKSILIEVFLTFVLAVLLYFCICFLLEYNSLMEIYNNSNNANLSFEEMFGYGSLYKGLFLLFAAIIDTAAIILIALKDFKGLTAQLQARKAARQQAKAERAEADKETKIAELEKQLEELKKD